MSVARTSSVCVISTTPKEEKGEAITGAALVAVVAVVVVVAVTRSPSHLVYKNLPPLSFFPLLPSSLLNTFPSTLPPFITSSGS